MDLISKYQSRVDEKAPPPKEKFLVMSDLHMGTLARDEYREQILREMLANWQNEPASVTNIREEGGMIYADAQIRPRQAVDYITMTVNLGDTIRPNRNGTIYSSEALRRGIEMHERYGGAVINPSGIASLRGLSTSASFIDEYSLVEAAPMPILCDWEPDKKISPQDVAKAVMSND